MGELYGVSMMSMELACGLQTSSTVASEQAIRSLQSTLPPVRKQAPLEVDNVQPNLLLAPNDAGFTFFSLQLSNCFAYSVERSLLETREVCCDCLVPGLYLLKSGRSVRYCGHFL